MLLVVTVFVAGFAKDGRPAEKQTPVVRQVNSEKKQAQLVRLRNTVGAFRVRAWSCQDHLDITRTRASVTVWALPTSVPYRAWVSDLWENRAAKCMAVLRENQRQYDWQSWLPDKWARVGACETGYGKRPGNWHHANSRFVSAFGISRQAYDEDAAVYGAPPWNDAHHPTPFQQYQAARGHYYLHGGFSGWGCRGA